MITKAYDAFRKNKNVKQVDTLISTEEYLQAKFREFQENDDSARMTRSKERSFYVYTAETNQDLMND